ncbi:Riboflavin kinase [Yarrowia sp. C11]|nr:Riboflavin kinase [Yarrowia sp. E02]KAG5371680.1 Riboflavin kinase [Yarrowia sp. C11]
MISCLTRTSTALLPLRRSLMTATTSYPLKFASSIIPGYGRGSADLGIPTANIPISDVPVLDALETGIYYGLVQILKTDKKSEKKTSEFQKYRVVDFQYTNQLSEQEINAVLPMVMSVGWNPFYQNDQKSAEIHIIHKFAHTFYGASIKVMVLGYLRPEKNFTSLEALVDEIHNDIRVSQEKMEGVEERKDGFWKS